MSEKYANEFVNLINANKVGNETSIKRQYQMASYIHELEAENKKLVEALEDSEETLKYVLQYFEGKAMSAEDDIKYSLKLIKQALKDGE